MLTVLHVCALFFSIAVILLADKQGFAWVSGKAPVLDRKVLSRYHALTWVGLAILILTGVLLLLPRADFLLRQPLFAIKLLFVGILVVNAVLIGRFMDAAVTRPFSRMTFRELSPLLLTGAISMFAWAGAIITALAVFHIFPFS